MRSHLNSAVLALFLAGFAWAVLAATQGGRELKSVFVGSASDDCCAIDRSDNTARFQEKCACGLCACSTECHGEGCDCPKPCSCMKCGCPRKNGRFISADSDRINSAGSDHIIWAGSDGPISRTIRR
jgi:hypothetical protein